MEADNKSNPATPIERRADSRVVLKVPVEISEIDEQGHPVNERTFIEDVSDLGCQFSIQGTVKQGDKIAVRLLAQDGMTLEDEPAKLFEVMWVAQRASGRVVGVRIVRGEKAGANNW